MTSGIAFYLLPDVVQAVIANTIAYKSRVTLAMAFRAF
jgi:hypothetical protein